MCAGCAAKQQHADANKKPPPGQKVYVVDARPAELELAPWSLSAAGSDHDPGDDEADAQDGE